MHRALNETGKFPDRRMRDKAFHICTVFASFYFDVYSLETRYADCQTAFCRSLICNQGGGVFIVR